MRSLYKSILLFILRVICLDDRTSRVVNYIKSLKLVIWCRPKFIVGIGIGLDNLHFACVGWVNY